MELKSGILSFRLNTSLTFTQVDLWLGLSYCDGKWNKVIIKKKGSVLSTSMSELMEHVSESRAQPLMVNSPIYVGGTPRELHDSYKHLKLEQGKLHQEEFPSQYSPGPTRSWWFCVSRQSSRIRLKAITTHPFSGRILSSKKITKHFFKQFCMLPLRVCSHMYLQSIYLF